LCQREFLSFTRLREWRDIHTQLRIACRQLGLQARPGPAGDERYEAVHTALLSGLLDNIARHDEGREYTASRNRTLRIFPGSAQARKSPKWLVAAETVETTGVFAREVAAIDPAWALSINPDLLKYHHYQPRWHSRRGQVVASERVTLYGLTLADKRVAHYGPIAPAESRELMIREGLIPGNMRQPPTFLRHNRKLVQELENLESRTRRRDILVEEEVQFDFYDERLPENLYTASGLRSWLKHHPEAERGLYMTREGLTARDPGAAVGEQFPDHLDYEDLRFRLSYQFEPGDAADGVSVTVPVALLNRAPRFLLDWLVPGLLREKCIQLVKGLPKEKRKRLVPAPDYVDRALAQLQPGDTDLLRRLAECMAELGGIQLDRGDWALHKLDDYYRMNIRVVDAGGRLLAQGRDLGELVRRFRATTRQSLGAGEDTPAREGITRWDLGELPREWRFRQAGVDITAYPALVDRGSAVAIELCDYPGMAQAQHRLGVLRLLRLVGAQQGKYLRKQLLRGNETSLVLAACGLDPGALVEDLVDAAYIQAMGLDGNLPRRSREFSEMERRGRGEVTGRAGELEATLLAALQPLVQVYRRLGALDGGRWQDTRGDIADQLSLLFRPSFLRDTPAEWIVQYPRYVRALEIRLERLAGQYPRDRKYTAMLGELARPLRSALEERPTLLWQSPEARAYRWMLEEFRVSLFAQQLGTRQPVSQKRLVEQWRAVEEWRANNPR
jgi:ATP-dependent helicase HrpA